MSRYVIVGAGGADDLLTVLPQLRSGDVLIDAATLRKLLDGPEPPAVLDVRWALGDPKRPVTTGPEPR